MTIQLLHVASLVPPYPEKPSFVKARTVPVSSGVRSLRQVRPSSLVQRPGRALAVETKPIRGGEGARPAHAGPRARTGRSGAGRWRKKEHRCAARATAGGTLRRRTGARPVPQRKPGSEAGRRTRVPGTSREKLQVDPLYHTHHAVNSTNSPSLGLRRSEPA